MGQSEKPPPWSGGDGLGNERFPGGSRTKAIDDSDRPQPRPRLSFRLTVEIGYAGPGEAASPDDLNRQIGRLARLLAARNAPPPERVSHLAKSIYALGERPLFELLSELIDGAPLVERMERYAQLAPLGAFLEAFGGADPPRLVEILAGGEEL